MPPHLMGDVTRVRQILTNLVSNALKFTEKGEVAIEVSCIADPAREKSASNAPLPNTASPMLANAIVTVRFSVRDTGIGIPADKHGQLFQAFSQADLSTTRKFGGTGLGLAICKRLAQLMGGDAWLESTPGCGSTFHFSIKAEPAAAPVAATVVAPRPTVARHSEANGNHGAALRLLLVEDNLVNQKVALAMLQRCGYKADIANDGIEGVDRVKAQDYDVVLMDWHMPRMNGLEATAAIRAEVEAGRQPWIIGLTANAMTGDRERCMQAGMDDYITKPLKRDDLLAAFARAQLKS